MATLAKSNNVNKRGKNKDNTNNSGITTVTTNVQDVVDVTNSTPSDSNGNVITGGHSSIWCTILNFFLSVVVILAIFAFGIYIGVGVQQKLDSETFNLDKYYIQLKIPPGSPYNSVKQAYKRLSTEYHPDKNGELISEEWNNVQKAWAILKCHLNPPVDIDDNDNTKTVNTKESELSDSISKLDSELSEVKETLKKTTSERDNLVNQLEEEKTLFRQVKEKLESLERINFEILSARENQKDNNRDETDSSFVEKKEIEGEQEVVKQEEIQPVNEDKEEKEIVEEKQEFDEENKDDVKQDDSTDIVQVKEGSIILGTLMKPFSWIVDFVSRIYKFIFKIFN